MLNIEKVLELKENLIDYFANNSFGEGMFDDTALSREVSDAICGIAGNQLQTAANIALDDLGINPDDLADLYCLAETAAAAQGALSIAIMKASPLFPIV
ncbi:hypothetical protein [Novosphingobium sp.]|uniref:hypothetical protein n=1 Tax=Novosphingobium sp. TaxID=1874826 RepID=UPI002FE42001